MTHQRRHQQLGFDLLDEKSARYFGGTKNSFGGAHLKNSHAKTKRIITTKKPMHLVIRSTKAIGSRSLLRKAKSVYAIVEKQARLHSIKIYRYANAGNHLHLVVMPVSRGAFNNFIRALTGLIARLVLGVEKGQAKNIQFWDQRPYTRVVTWGRDFKRVSQYLLQNTLEAIGFVAYRQRTKRLLRPRSNNGPLQV